MTKKVLQIISMLIIITAISCGSAPDTYTGETQMSDNVSCTLTENTYDKNCFADVELISWPKNYHSAKLIVDGREFDFIGKNATYMPKQYGDVDCEIQYFDEAGELIETRTDTLKLYVETWYIASMPDIGHPARVMDNNAEVLLFTEPRARGNDDICFMYELRIPHGETLTFSAATAGKLQVHFRLDDYDNRNSLYTPPDEAMYHIDAETDKWIASPYEIGEGVHRLYVAPSRRHTLSFLEVRHSGEMNGKTTGYFRSLDWEALGLP